MSTRLNIKNTTISVNKTGEGAIQQLLEAKRLKDDREGEYTSDLKKKINREDYLDSIKEELNLRSQAFRYHIFEMGKLLYEVKCFLEHGKYQLWVDKNFIFGRKTAHNFVRVYIACIGHPEVVQYFNPSCLYVVSAPNYPNDLREALFEGVNGKVDVKKKELVQIAMKYKKGDLKITDKEVQDLLKKQKVTSMQENYIIELKTLKKLIDDGLQKIEKIPKFNSSNPLIEKYTNDEIDARDEEDYDITKMIKGFIAKTNTKIKELEEKCN